MAHSVIAPSYLSWPHSGGHDLRQRKVSSKQLRRYATDGIFQWFIVLERPFQTLSCGVECLSAWFVNNDACIILFGTPEGNRPLGRFGRRWEDNIRMDLTERGWEVVDWMHLAQDRDQWWAVVNTVMNLGVLYKAGNLLTSWVTISFSSMTLLMKLVSYNDLHV
jgi:hypothetical protein